MREKTLLTVDAVVNLMLGTLLLVYPEGFMHTLGLPVEGPDFYANLLGAVILGISLALFLEGFGADMGLRGLGLAGAVGINLGGGTVLVLWLLLGDLGLHPRGVVLLWGLAAGLAVLSLIEIVQLISGESR